MINIVVKSYINKIGSKIKFGKLIVVMPNGNEFIFKGKKGIEGKLILKSYKPIIRTILGGHLGFSESYLNHEWEKRSAMIFARKKKLLNSDENYA